MSFDPQYLEKEHEQVVQKKLRSTDVWLRDLMRKHAQAAEIERKRHEKADPYGAKAAREQEALVQWKLHTSRIAEEAERRRVAEEIARLESLSGKKSVSHKDNYVE